ncbi:hypothetical protein D477_009353 [Arthrobacter crystallopoietes BAB-32]|uniref:Uncharacterized protein n=1 Tax=Arthrobacter crystallopoietes BAB-32 TaxID=1246476 RepID=N1V355_9MICC|nr:hypothetical protein [Arthrobacter crystallopoietes]EMY34502.1 hypothetical protein D477_009353 [Arthrobacter crystallopoietes BAB-32]
MMKKLLFGAGLAAGFVLGSRAGRGCYDQLKSTASHLWRAGMEQPAPSSGRRAQSGTAAADAVSLPAEGPGAARDQDGLAAAAAHSGPPSAGRRVGTDPGMDDRPGSEWPGRRSAESVETVNDPEEELGHS